MRSSLIAPLGASLLFFAAQTGSHGQLVNGLLNYWPFDGDAQDKASDFTGHASTTEDDGTVNGSVTFAAGRTGFGLTGSFPGGNGNGITIPDPGAAGAFANDIDRTGSDLSISVWVRLDNIDNGWQAILAHGEGRDYRIAYRDPSDPIQYAWAGGGDSSDIFSTAGYGNTPGGDGNWHHIVATTAGSSTALYIDGTLQATGGTGPIEENGQNLLCIGCNPDAGREWNGLIDDIGMWNRALSLAEVQQIYNAGVAATPIDLGALLNSQSADTDNDNLPDGYENSAAGNLTALDGTLPAGSGPGAGTGDFDGDGISDFDEFDKTRTNPTLADSDSDQLDDKIETDGTANTWVAGNPTGPPGDATNPLVADTDGDGVDDGPETVAGTDPNNPDTDGDSLPDNIDPAPTDSSLPGPTSLPIVDNFDDNALNPFNWSPNLNVPTGSPAVIEQNGRLEVTGRGHLNTRSEYDPASGGLAVCGEFIFGSADFFQVLTQSDGTPETTGSGETQNGVEFLVNSGDGNLQLVARGAGFTISQTATGSVGPIQQGERFEFQITDDGTALTFRFTSLDNPARGAIAGGTITADTGTSNFVTFHNREGVSTSSFDNLSIYPLNLDSDNDLLPDWWEVKHGLDPNDDGLGMGNPNNGKDGDPDSDNLTNEQELALGTDPDQADSDCDNIPDGEELSGANGSVTDPLDADSDDDGFSDGFEVASGTSPTNGADFPTGGADLPVADNFDDSFLNPLLWKTDLNIPQGGANVFEKGGRVSLVQRGHLVTQNQYDPATGGLVIRGEWTFVETGDTDVLQILTQSDGIADPNNCCGETTSGVEFHLPSNSGDLIILSRGAVSVTQTTTGSIGPIARGTPLRFEITDDGTALTFTVTEIGNEANTASVTGAVTGDSVNQNFIVFHNREGADRVAHLDNVSISRFAEPAPLRITDVIYDPVGDQFTLTWNSQEGRFYSIFSSADGTDWTFEVIDSIGGASGATTTTFGPFLNPFTTDPGQPTEVRPATILFRVQDTGAGPG